MRMSRQRATGGEREDGPRRLSRRRFFRLGAAGTIALGAGGLLAWHSSGYEVPSAVSRRLANLSEKEYLIVEALADRILRSDDGALPPPREVDTALSVDALLSTLHPADRRDLLRLLHVIEHALPPWEGMLSRFTRLDGAEQDAVLEAMQSGSSHLMRAGFEGIKSICALAYFRDDRTWEAIGYDGPLVGRRA